VQPAYPPQQAFPAAGYPPSAGDPTEVFPAAAAAPVAPQPVVAPAAAATPPAGWYADPNRPGGQRYWDGTAWTEHIA
jgi:hypothetical protein